MQRENDLDGHTALVTGASRGIGLATALQLSRQGASVAVNYRRGEASALEAVRRIQQEGGRAETFQADVTERSEVETMVQAVEARLGPVDILVNNAGVLYPGHLLQYDPEELQQMWDVNVRGLLHCSAAVVPHMRQKKRGRIINLSSIAAIGTALPGTTLYAATKAAVLALTRRMAYELGGEGIRVNAVCPGFITTDMVHQGRSPEEVERVLTAVSAKAVLGRPGVPEDVARVIGFLASDQSAFMSGQILTVDGGRMDYLSHA